MFDLFHLVTWDDLDLYCGHKAQEMILTDVSDTIHADSLALFALNIEILLADVAKPEKSKILTLTWPVTSSVTSGSNIWRCTGSSRTGLSNGVWNLEIGPVVWEISGGGLWAPPPEFCRGSANQAHGPVMYDVDRRSLSWRAVPVLSGRSLGGAHQRRHWRGLEVHRRVVRWWRRLQNCQIPAGKLYIRTVSRPVCLWRTLANSRMFVN